MRKLICTLLTVLPMTMMGQYKSQVWSPDNGDGTYTNPVINADYSDPDVCVGPSGEDYYMTASSFQCTPGLPILHSKDLVNWEIIGYALDKLYEGDDTSIHLSTAMVSGHRAFAIMRAGTTSIGVIPTSA